MAAYGEIRMTVDSAHNLAVGVDFIGSTNAPDAVDLYEVSDLSTPLLIARYSFPTNQQPNANFIAQSVVAGNRVFVLDGNNGIVAFNLVPPPQPALTVNLSGANVLLSWPNSFSGYSLYSSPSVTGPYSTPEGSGAVVGSFYWVTNSPSGSAKFYRLQK